MSLGNEQIEFGERGLGLNVGCEPKRKCTSDKNRDREEVADSWQLFTGTRKTRSGCG